MDKAGDIISVLQSISATIRQNNPVSAGDYIKDGFLMCKMCGTPMERLVRINHFGKMLEMVMPVACDCANAKHEATENFIRASKIEEMRKRFIPDSVYRSHRFELDDSPESRNSLILRAYAKKWESMMDGNKGLLFTGTVGMGKSFYACCVANAVVDMGYGAIVTTIPTCKVKLDKYEAKKALLEDIAEIPLLVLDDFGTESTTSTSIEQTNLIIDTRYKSGLPLIVTTNLTLENFQNPDIVAPRIADRILQMCPMQLKFVGESKRVDIAERSKAEMKKLLGE